MDLNLETLALIERAAAVMSGTAQHLWEIAVRQQVNSGWLDLVVGFVLAGIVAAIIYATKLLVRPIDECDMDIKCLAWGLGIGIACIAAAIDLSFFYHGILHLLNPEFYAMQAILGR